MSKTQALRKAVAEAERFLEAAKKRLKGTKLGLQMDEYSGAENAAAERASLDLTKALAVFRGTNRYEP